MPKQTTRQSAKKNTKSNPKRAKRSRADTKMVVKVKGKEVSKPSHRILIATGFILLPLIVGILSSAFTGDAMMRLDSLKQPPLAPPAWLFPVVWTVLYFLMGIASYLIFRLKPKTSSEKSVKRAELAIYFVQLVFNFFWSILFFKLELRFFAFGWLVTMWLMILALIAMSFKNCKAAAWCLLPYLLWCTFAAYLNIMVAVL